MLAPDQLERYRRSVADSNFEPWLVTAIGKAQQAGLEVWGQTLATAPRGYPKDHARIELLRRKNLTLGQTLKFGRGIGRSAGLEFVAHAWRTAAPVTRWLDQHVGASMMPPRPR